MCLGTAEPDALRRPSAAPAEGISQTGVQHYMLQSIDGGAGNCMLQSTSRHAKERSSMSQLPPSQTLQVHATYDEPAYNASLRCGVILSGQG